MSDNCSQSGPIPRRNTMTTATQQINVSMALATRYPAGSGISVSISRDQAGSPPPDGRQQLWAGGIDLDLLAQPPHVYCHRAHIAGKGVALHLIEQLLASEDLAGVLHQEAQQVKFARRERDGGAAQGDAARSCIEP